jgi:indolepyruvate ferredoxin oxidoreductase beta subunit
VNTVIRNAGQPAVGPNGSDIIKLAIMAVGGQGGGVLINWIEACARVNGYAVQATSVAGVAQRTGATIYYLEMAPRGEREPVFSLAPCAGDVDILIAAELMEAGRAIMRGFVTPDRTTLIASSHRALAVSEKSTPGDGIANSEEVNAAAEIAARRFIVFDMEKLAVDAGSMISASLLGALAGSGALPFSRDSFEAVVRDSKRGVENSLRAFSHAFDAVEAGALPRDDDPSHAASTTDIEPRGATNLVAAWQDLVAQVNGLPEPVRDMANRGLRKVVAFQDLDYGRIYVDHLKSVLTHDDPGGEFLLTREAAKYIANGMAYDDVIRVADLKTRGARFARIGREMGGDDNSLVHITEFMHPRAEEIVGLLPARFGRRIEASPAWMRRVDRMFNRGRRLRTDGLWAFMQLYLLGGLRGYRRRTLRHAVEVAHLEGWLAVAMGYADANYDLAVEVLRCRRLIKGYSDTHARGLSKYDRVLDGIALVDQRDDASDWAHRLRDAALADEKGKALDGALKTIETFA